MEYVIKHGTGFSVEVGSPEEPEITRWTSWGNGDLQQSFMLHTPEGTLITDPVLPQQGEALKILKQRAGRVAAIPQSLSLCTSGIFPKPPDATEHRYMVLPRLRKPRSMVVSSMRAMVQPNHYLAGYRPLNQVMRTAKYGCIGRLPKARKY